MNINQAPLDRIKAMLEPLLEADMFLVDMRIKPTNNIKIFLDADSGLPIERCIKVNRALYKQIEELAMYPDGDFSLEVSSPGIDEPLKLYRQYVKNTGRWVEVTLNDGSKLEGKLLKTEESAIVVAFMEGKGKKAVNIEKTISFDEIRQTKVTIKF
jgi:ribosome maturation factor RimP